MGSHAATVDLSESRTARHHAASDRPHARRRGRVIETEALALVIYSWNAHRSGGSRTKLQMPKGGLTPENFPEPR
jgi:hypothetical protein